MVEKVGDYPWSSYRCRAEGKSDPLADFDEIYRGLGTTIEACRLTWAGYVAEAIANQETDVIREAIRREHVTGGLTFQQEIAGKLAIRLDNRKPGRPRKLKQSGADSELPDGSAKSSMQASGNYLDL